MNNGNYLLPATDEHSLRVHLQYLRNRGMDQADARQVYFMLKDVASPFTTNLEHLHILYGKVFNQGFATAEDMENLCARASVPRYYAKGETSFDFFHGILLATQYERLSPVTKIEFAQRLHGRQYGREMLATDIELAKLSGLVVLYSQVDMLYMDGALSGQLELGRSLDVSIGLENKNGGIRTELYFPVKEEGEPLNWFRVQHYHDFGPDESIIGFVRIHAKVAQSMKIRYNRIKPVHIPFAEFTIFDGVDTTCIGCVVDRKHLTDN